MTPPEERVDAMLCSRCSLHGLVTAAIVAAVREALDEAIEKIRDVDVATQGWGWARGDERRATLAAAVKAVEGLRP